jgi:hypothetical protein
MSKDRRNCFLSFRTQKIKNIVFISSNTGIPRLNTEIVAVTLGGINGIT